MRHAKTHEYVDIRTELQVVWISLVAASELPLILSLAYVMHAFQDAVLEMRFK